jgi:outer membrane receptor protein involved in Fe transport
LVDDIDYNIVTGAEFRYDDGSRIGVEHTENGAFVEDITSSAIEERSYGAYIDSTWYLSRAVRLMGGLRADNYSFDVSALNSGSYEGSASDSKISFKGGLAWVASDNLEFYGNYGQGFHTNDARGVVNSADPVPGLSDGTGYEAGLRSTLGDLKVTAAYWWLDQDSELIFVGDSNAVEPKGGSEREGLELTMFWQPTDWLGMDASYSDSEARYTDNPEGDYVEQAVEEAAQFGVTVTQNDWDLSFRVRYLGPYALSADNSKRAESLTTANLRVSRHWNNLDIFAEVINLFDSDGKEIVYDYEAWIAGYDPAGLTSEDIDCDAINCRMSRATMPRALRVGMKYRFD